jgi:hypothetical protein
MGSRHFRERADRNLSRTFWRNWKRSLKVESPIILQLRQQLENDEKRVVVQGCTVYGTNDAEVQAGHIQILPRYGLRKRYSRAGGGLRA